MNKTFIIALCALNIAASFSWSNLMETGEEIKVIDGEPIDISKVPFQIALIRNGWQMCGGSIINKNFILTAAHCLRYDGDFSVRAGSKHWSYGGVEVKVDNITIHPDYSGFEYGNDIAILHLAEPLKFSDVIRPAKLAEPSYDIPDNDIMQITGWGDTMHGKPTKLQSVELPKLNFQKCKELMREAFGILLPRNCICAMHPDGGHNASPGESGGPMTHNGTQVGVAAFGGPWFHPRAPSAFTGVQYYREWIQSIAGTL